jgi:DNA-binding PadR family transcriptional regulator
MQGALDLLILKALSLGPLHGYSVIRSIRQLSDALLEAEQGSLSGGLPDPGSAAGSGPGGWRPETGRRAKFYTLTKAGSG